MGKADVNVNIWLSEKNRFANLFNGVIYGGENVILPEDLQVILTMLKYRKAFENHCGERYQEYLKSANKGEVNPPPNRVVLETAIYSH